MGLESFFDIIVKILWFNCCTSWGASLAKLLCSSLMTSRILDGQLKRLSETFIDNQVPAGEEEIISLLQSNCSFFSVVLAVFCLVVQMDTMEKMSPRDYIVILSCRSYFFIYINGPKIVYH